MKKENIRILFNKDKEARIVEYEIAEFVVGDEKNWPGYLYQKYDSDIGNCLSSWNDYTLADVLLRVGFIFGFKDRDLGHKFIEELLEIEEFRESCGCWRNNQE